ncbi:dihydrolipoyl dehydrogenase [[Clostridium] hylemonae]|uniref:dihydrolipoyl dehydrogenase n=1 Tax=[Clostridium] hylemonae TaxID=89153 RepID=UPI001FCC71FD|nr:dihydrolipoyl dehydrogenase [[Clostridium] hylemonae]BDF04278.1 dihydrolipoyl dehydrogenase [[Clostridium] hylemonae]
MEHTFDLIVIGAGPGGYVAAVKAAKLGLKTAVIEAGRAGGTCLNRGCIPAKAMIHASSLYQEVMSGGRFGVSASDVTYDYKKILSYKEETTEQLCQGVEQLLKANKVELINGKGVLTKERSVKVTADGKETVYEAEHVILAAGARPLMPPIPGLSLPGVLTSDDVFRLEAVPDSLLIIGGGVISVEFATVYQALGCRVTIVEAMPRLVPNMDKEISQNLKMIMKKRGVDIHTGASVKAVEQDGEQLACLFEEKGKEYKISSGYVLCAVGRAPNTDGLLEEETGIRLEKGRIAVDSRFRTDMEGVYAIGDLIKGTQLAHAASAQGMYVAEVIAGAEPSVDLDVIPGCVYTNPEIASVGMSEEEAKENGIEVKTGKFIMSANGKSLITKEERGFVKVVAEEQTGIVLGAQMMCARATDMIGEFTTAIANKLTVKQMLRAVRAHPTYNEGVGEALEEVFGEAIHVVPRRR